MFLCKPLAQVRSEVLEAYACIRDPSGSWTALLWDTWLPGSLYSCARLRATSRSGWSRQKKWNLYLTPIVLLHNDFAFEDLICTLACKHKQWEKAFVTTFRKFLVSLSLPYCAHSAIITRRNDIVYFHLQHSTTFSTQHHWRCRIMTIACLVKLSCLSALKATSLFSAVCHFSMAHYETYYSSLITFEETDGERERGLKWISCKSPSGKLNYK